MKDFTSSSRLQTKLHLLPPERALPTLRACSAARLQLSCKPVKSCVCCQCDVRDFTSRSRLQTKLQLLTLGWALTMLCACSTARLSCAPLKSCSWMVYHGASVTGRLYLRARFDTQHAVQVHVEAPLVHSGLSSFCHGLRCAAVIWAGQVLLPCTHKLISKMQLLKLLSRSVVYAMQGYQQDFPDLSCNIRRFCCYWQVCHWTCQTPTNP